MVGILSWVVLGLPWKERLGDSEVMVGGNGCARDHGAEPTDY